jgi:hypothetical protein
MNYRNNQDSERGSDFEYGKNKKKKIGAGTVMRWTVYLVCLFILGTVIYRVISTGTPGELRNFIIQNQSVQRAYTEFKDDLVIYNISVRQPFAIGDNLFADNVYYIENAENLQIMLRCKNERYRDLPGSIFRVLLKVTDTTAAGLDIFDMYDMYDTRDTHESESGADPEETEQRKETEEINDGVILLESVTEHAHGRETDRYRYFVYSFDGVKIDYANTRIELYVFLSDEENFPEIDYSIARFTVFDRNMQKRRAEAKNFNF